MRQTVKTPPTLPSSSTQYTSQPTPLAFGPRTLEEHTLEMRVDVERRRMEIRLSQPAPPPQCDSSPRWSPAVGTGSEEPGLLRAGTQSTEREELFPLQASLDGCMSLDQEGTIILLQTNVGLDDAETTNFKAHIAAREDFARPPKKRQQQRAAWGNEQAKQFDPGG